MTSTLEYVDVGLELLLEDEPPRRCKVMTGICIGRFRYGRPCRRPAVAHVVVQCPAHGSSRHPICQGHLRLLRAMRWIKLTRCARCNRRVRWAGDPSL